MWQGDMWCIPEDWVEGMHPDWKSKVGFISIQLKGTGEAGSDDGISIGAGDDDGEVNPTTLAEMDGFPVNDDDEDEEA